MYIADSRRLTNAGAKKMIEAATAKAAERDGLSYDALIAQIVELAAARYAR